MTPILCILLVAAIAILYRWSSRIERRPLPPGPPKDPLIGHFRYMPTAQAPFVFHEWAKTYGWQCDASSSLGKSMIILDTVQAAVDLLDKKGSIYSDRPPLPLYELLGWTYMLSFMRYGKTFTSHRQPMQTQEARQLVRNLFASSTEEYGAVLSKFTTSILVQVVAGHKIDSITTRISSCLRWCIRFFRSQARPAALRLISFQPSMEASGSQAIRLSSGMCSATEGKRASFSRTFLTSFVKEAGNAAPSFLLSQLEEIDNNTSELNYEELKGAAATLFGAELPTRSAVAVFLLAMVLNPECQVRAQKEIDSVVGTSRLLHLKIAQNYRGIQLLRSVCIFYGANVPDEYAGVPHRSTQDDVYRGMHIPKGSLVIANVRGMSLDESTYKNPTKFIPERFLSPPLGTGEPHFSCLFGFGRRKCPAVHFVERNLWIAIVSILATCTVSNALDEHGKAIVPEASMSDGVDSYPNDLRCVINPRFKEVEALLEESILSPTA
ncbi:cytochrome P450 [Mycena leptocephala]|nr:cytochrome P450 [Mycena leptocephala]